MKERNIYTLTNTYYFMKKKAEKKSSFYLKQHKAQIKNMPRKLPWQIH